jgi:ferredoxin
MKRKIIQIDDKKCNGCGQCIPNCPEGALQMIDGKARLVSDLFCDGLGACIGECPVGAITVVEREAEPYDERKVMANIIPQGINTIKAHLKHHNEHELYQIAIEVLKGQGIEVPAEPEEKPAKLACGCPGTLARAIERAPVGKNEDVSGAIASELRQWPVQLHLINPMAAYFDDADLLISADCVPYSYGDFHRKFLRGKMVITFCPKLDGATELYVEKLTELFRLKRIKSVSVVRMEVPCCGGTEAIVRRALEAAGKSTEVKVNIISVNGSVIS